MIAYSGGEDMVYDLIPQRLPVLSTIFLVILWNIINDYFDGTFFSLFFILLLFAVSVGPIRFRFKMMDDHLVYQILYFKKSILRKNIYPNQIVQIKYIRVGWAKKGAIIKVNKGLNFRLTILKPQTAYDDLLKFSNKHDITVLKTKDYILLEKYF